MRNSFCGALMYEKGKVFPYKQKKNIPEIFLCQQSLFEDISAYGKNM